MGMKRVIDISEIVEAIDLPEGPGEVCAAGDAEYDEAQGRLSIRVDSFIRPSDPRSRGRCLVPGWLPKAQTTQESVSLEEAVPVAKDIFRRWVQKVRRSVPAAGNFQPGGKTYVTKIHD